MDKIISFNKLHHLRFSVIAKENNTKEGRGLGKEEDM
jgi:hypothetical protein